jgi:hypothetical protein
MRVLKLLLDKTMLSEKGSAKTSNRSLYIDAGRKGFIAQILWNHVCPRGNAVGYFRPPRRFQAAR